ncbi:MAG: thioredoxin family protein [Croceivirga sp.]
MFTLAENPINSIEVFLQKALKESLNYEEYRELVHQLATDNSNTGLERTEALANYTKLNDRRMGRWDKTLKMPETVIDKIKSLNQKLTWLVITESWCGDASPSLPVMNKMAELSSHLELRIVLRDEHPELMDVFLTNGARSIPKLIVLNGNTNDVLGEWGPRSPKATEMVMDEKKWYGKLRPEFKQELQVFYNKDKGEDILNDLVSLLSDLK